MYKVIILCITLLYLISLSGISQSFTDVKILYPDDTILVNLTDKEVKRIERKTRQYINEFACDQIIFDDSKTYSLDSAKTYYDMQFINAIDRIPNDLLHDMVLFCGMNISRRGWSVDLEAGYGFYDYQNYTLTGLTNEENGYNWTYTPNSGFNILLSGYYYLNNNLAIRTGFGYQSFNPIYSLYGNFSDNKLSLDLNRDSFYASYEIHIDSSLTLNQFTIPVTVSYTSGKPGKPGIFAETGLVFAINTKTLYKTTGYLSYYGYYPDHPEPTQTLHIEALGFYTEKDINRSGRLFINSINAFAYASAGLLIPAGFYSNLKIGADLYYGLNDIDRKEKYTDIFGNRIDRKPTLLKKYGLKLSYILKL